MPTDLAPAYTDDQLDAAIRHLQRQHRHAFLQYAVTVGHYLAEHFHGGDYAEALAAGPQGGIQALVARRRAELDELDLSGRTLRKYLAASAVWRELPEATREKLGIDHLERLSAVSDAGQRKKLANDAAAMHWTRDQVAIAVKNAQLEQRGRGKKPGPKPQPKPLRLTGALGSAVTKLAAGQGAVKSMSDANRAKWRANIEEAIARLQALLG
jgi:hypothetical protein